MPLGSLQHWEDNALHLHNASRILGVLRTVYYDHMPNFLEMPMKILADGLSTGVLPSGSEAWVNFGTLQLHYRDPQGKETVFEINGHSQKSLLEALLGVMKAGEFATQLADALEGALIDGLYEWAEANKASFPIHKTDVISEDTLTIDQQVAQEYAEAQYQVFTGVARFRAHLVGFMTPIVVWPEHFDLSTLWFATDKADEYAPHMNFGFSPYSPGIPRPYFYAYAYPYVEGYTAPMLAAPLRWEDKAYRGVYAGYDDIATAPDVATFIEHLCEVSYQRLLKILNK